MVIGYLKQWKTLNQALMICSNQHLSRLEARHIPVDLNMLCHAMPTDAVLVLLQHYDSIAVLL